MSAYIRSKISNSDFTDVSIEAKDSNAKVRQDGTFKLPIASGVSADTPVGSIRYNDLAEKIEFKTTAGWQVLDAITDGLATEAYVDSAVETAVNGLSQVARTGSFADLTNKPTTIAGYGITDDLASTSYVDTAISNLVSTAPEFLNTLDEIAAALNNDPNFYNSVVTQLSNKLNLTGGTLTGPLYLSGAPTLENQAATKAYVDELTAGVTVYSTDDIPEGVTNLYYTTARAEVDAKNSLSAGLGVTYNSATGAISIGQEVSTSSNVEFNNVTANTITADSFEIASTGDYLISSATNIILDAGMEVVVNSPLTLPGYATTALDDLVVQAGTIAYDTTVNLLKIYDGTAWVEIEGGPEFSGSYNDLTDKPTLFSGAYADLSGKPTIPTALSQLTNDAGFITTESDAQTLSLVGNTLSISNGNSVTIQQFSGSYDDLTNKPTLFSGAYADLSGKPTIPTALSQLTNDAGFITTESDAQTLSLVDGILSISGGNSVTLEISWENILNKNTASGPMVVAIGQNAGINNPGEFTVAIGQSAGQDDQRDHSIAIGTYAGETAQAEYSIAIGWGAGRSDQQYEAVAIGDSAGYNNQGYATVAVGYNAGNDNQGDESVALGLEAGQTNQGQYAVSIGTGAGSNNQSDLAIAIGSSAGKTSQAAYSVAIGSGAGMNNLGDSAIAIGKTAGYADQAANSIVINATGEILNNTVANSLVIKPIRNASGTTILYYDSTTGEITYNTASIDWNDITGKPTFATVATSGDYNDLTNKPVIPTDINQLTDNSNLLGSGSTSTSTVIIHDNFTGSAGSLLSHTPDIAGGPWLDYINEEYVSLTADAFSLDGNGNVYLDTYSWNEDGAVYSSTTSTSNNFIIEADLEIILPMQAYSQIFFLFKGDPVNNGQTDWDLRFSQMELFLDDSGFAYVGLGSRQLDGNGIYSTTPADAMVDVSVGTHQLKLVVSGLTLSMYYDNVLIGARTVDALSEGTHFGFSIRTNDDLGRLGLSNFKVTEVTQTSSGGGASQWSDISLDGGTDFTESDGTEFANGELMLTAGELDSEYTPAISADWSGTPPQTVGQALDRIAALLKTLNGGVGP